MLNKILHVWYVGVGQMPYEDVPNFMKTFIDRVTFDEEDSKNISVFYIPRRNGQTKLEVIDTNSTGFVHNHSFQKFLEVQQSIIEDIENKYSSLNKDLTEQFWKTSNEYRWYKNQSIFKIILGRIKDKFKKTFSTI